MENKIPMHIDKEDPLYKAIFALPKTDLHCHLDGSLRIETIIDLIGKQGVTFPVDKAKLEEQLIMDDMVYSKEKSLERYLKAFAYPSQTTFVLSSPSKTQTSCQGLP